VKETRVIGIALACLLILSLIALAQGRIDSLVVSGGSGSAPVAQINGKNYVEIEALARTLNGSLSFQGNQMTLTPGAGNGSGTPAGSSNATGTDGTISRDFLSAGIEAMSSLREWHSALASGIANGFPITLEGLSSYQAQAGKNLKLAEAAATTTGDQKMAGLIADAYVKMKALSDKYLEQRQNMNYVSQDALQNDPLDQSLIACGKTLVAMAASRQYSDNATCQ
jgi:hypothetical protein